MIYMVLKDSLIMFLFNYVLWPPSIISDTVVVWFKIIVFMIMYVNSSEYPVYSPNFWEVLQLDK